ncbi:dentin sialophosphoprotein-like [Gigantopelta aegis]|uniref:dentin sialophosphoprotein-like n=1 Tax=Gigantopelta aegis TaxID=1735272 RepID=UPI001B889059|nr:dentin sialophosphoprotein-like [Gigantopelta aegis]
MYWGSGPSGPRGSKTGQQRPKSRKLLMLKSGSVGDELEILEKDREIHTNPDETRRRRTIKLFKERGSWGFTLQTYGIKNKCTNTLEVMTYVDYVEMNGPANFAGMRKGDVILSVNGTTVEDLTHKELVVRIQESSNVLRLVILFEDCCRKVELYDRFIKLKQLLALKHEELRRLDFEEMSILQSHGITRLSVLRQSSRSSTSSDWDRFSVVSPSALQSASNSRLWRDLSFPSVSSQACYSNDDLSLCNDSFSEDSDAFLSSGNSCPDISVISARGREDTDSTRSVNSQKSFHDGSLHSLGSVGSTCSSGVGVVSCAILPKSSEFEHEKEQASKGDNSDEPINKGTDSTESINKEPNSTEPKYMGPNSSELTNKTDNSNELKNKENTNSSVQNNKGNNSGEFTVDATKKEECTGGVTNKQRSSTDAGDSNASKADNSDIKGDNPTELQISTETVSDTNEKATKKLLHGVLVNEDDYVTKL